MFAALLLEITGGRSAEGSGSRIHCPPDEIQPIGDGLYCPPGEIQPMRDGLNAIARRIHCPPGEIQPIGDGLHCPPGEIQPIRNGLHAIARGLHARNAGCSLRPRRQDARSERSAVRKLCGVGVGSRQRAAETGDRGQLIGIGAGHGVQFPPGGGDPPGAAVGALRAHTFRHWLAMAGGNLRWSGPIEATLKP